MSEVGRTRMQGGTSEGKKNPDKKKGEDQKDGFGGTSVEAGFNRGGAGKLTAALVEGKGVPIHLG